MSSMVTIDIANNFVSLLLGVLSVIGVFIGFVAWFIRLESKVTYLEKDYGDNKVKQGSMNETIQATLNQVLISLGELKGKIDHK